EQQCQRVGQEAPGRAPCPADAAAAGRGLARRGILGGRLLGRWHRGGGLGRRRGVELGRAGGGVGRGRGIGGAGAAVLGGGVRRAGVGLGRAAGVGRGGGAGVGLGRRRVGIGGAGAVVAVGGAGLRDAEVGEADLLVAQVAPVVEAAVDAPLGIVARAVALPGVGAAR